MRRNKVDEFNRIWCANLQVVIICIIDLLEIQNQFSDKVLLRCVGGVAGRENQGKRGGYHV